MNPYLVLIIGIILGSTSGIFIKLLALPTTSIAFFRLSVPLIITFIYLKLKRIKLFTGNYKVMLYASLFNAIRLFFYFAAFLYTSMTNAAIILFTWPIFAAIFGIFILNEKITKEEFFLFGLAFLGIIVMNIGKEFTLENNDIIGMGSMLISAIVLALANVSFKKVIKDYSNMETIFYQNLIGTFLFLPFIFINKPLPNFEQFYVGIFYAILIGLVVFYLFFYSMRRIKMIQYSLFKYFEVLFNIIFGILIFNDQLTLPIIIGGLMIILSGILLRLKADFKLVNLFSR